MKRPTRFLFRVGALTVAGAVLCATVLVAAEFLFAPPMDYIVRAEFEQLPSSDKELEQWLLRQPGVYIGFVQREDHTVVLVWGHATNRFWDPVTPDVRTQFERFGYKGLRQYLEEKSHRDK